MTTTSQKQGYLNRHTDGLPKEKCLIKIITNDIEGEHIFLCEWIPFNESDYIGKVKPNEGFLGTATVIDGKFTGIGFHAWDQNDSEFIWYQIVNV